MHFYCLRLCVRRSQRWRGPLLLCSHSWQHCNTVSARPLQLGQFVRSLPLRTHRAEVALVSTALWSECKVRNFIVYQTTHLSKVIWKLVKMWKKNILTGINTLLPLIEKWDSTFSLSSSLSHTVWTSSFFHWMIEQTSWSQDCLPLQRQRSWKISVFILGERQRMSLWCQVSVGLRWECVFKPPEDCFPSHREHFKTFKYCLH